MKTVYKISIIGGLGLGLIAVMAYFSKQSKLLSDACYTITGAIIHEINFNKVSFTMMLNISNNSDIDVTITNQRYHIYVNKMLVAKIDKPERVKVRANGKTTVNIDIKFNPQDLLKTGMQNIASLIQDKEKIIIELKGYLSLKAGLISVKDYEVDERLSLAELLAPTPSKEKC